MMPPFLDSTHRVWYFVWFGGGPAGVEEDPTNFEPEGNSCV
jgi:hypothetical protein